jgi:aryl-alcohol dehydrogenase-like predicted oxidoreductase
MRYNYIGKSGLRVSNICMGTMTFGKKCDKKTSFEILDKAYGLTKALETSRYRGFKRFESIQNNFSMLNRRFLDEIAIVCQKEQVGLLPFSPLAGGVLSGKYTPGGKWDGFRFGDYLQNPDHRMRAQAGRFANERSLAAAQKYAAIAGKYGLAPATMAAAWTLRFAFVPSTIIGATTPGQLDDTLAASETILSEELLKECDTINREILYPMG